MRTIEETKDEVAQEIGYKDWEDYTYNNNADLLCDAVAKRRAEDAIKEALLIVSHLNNMMFDEEDLKANLLEIINRL